MLKYILLSMLIGGLIGWSTNVLAIKLIFRPYRPYNILGLFTLQGLIPKRRSELARVIGETIEKNFLSGEEIVNRLVTPDLEAKVVFEITQNIKQKVVKIVPSFILAGFKSYLDEIIENIVQAEVKKFFRETFPKLATEMKDSLPIASIVEEKINQLDLRELEILILKIVHKELKHIEYLGGILGGTIGLVQGVLISLLT
ncbi:MAG: DUF445 family protein [Clostridia bacterium]|nr:DUF445 family protein [Clostridia bacterium]